ncbi:MAG: branched-chain amino acid ABC transporter permease [Deltaproteobacteria bacterium]|nr:MAG: branched-chain amino acid ABC transporter permease [Deltaproteobacteria bacterium]
MFYLSVRHPKLKQPALLLIALSGLILFLLLAPSLWGGYARILLFTILLYVTMAVSYDVVGGMLGYLYLGHGLFFGLGAYITALALKNGQTLPLALLLGAFLVLPVAAFLSLPLFRLQGAVFALATLGLLLLGGQLASNLPDLTGGAAGLSLPPNTNPMLTYSLALLLALATVLMHWLLCSSSLGLQLSSINENEDMAESVGINCAKVKRLALIISAVPAAMAGGLHAREISFVIPAEAFGLENSLAPLLMCLLFKPGTTWGPLLGALVLSTAQEFIWTTVPSFRLSLYGILLIFIGMQRARRSYHWALGTKH